MSLKYKRSLMVRRIQVSTTEEINPLRAENLKIFLELLIAAVLKAF